MLAATTLEAASAMVVLIVALFVGGSIATRHGEQIEKRGPRGTRPEPPGFRKPPGGDGGLL